MILAIDTATRWLGLALHDGTAVLAEQGWRSFQTQTVELMPAIGEMLKREGITAVDLKAIAVAIGPGSYTGLRVGLAAAKGMALANRTPLIGVSTLDILAAATGPYEAQLLIAAEAGRSRVCAAIYRWHSRHGWQAHNEPVIEAWPELLAQLNRPTVATGEITADAAKLIRKAGHQVVPAAAATRRAGYLAEIGWQRLRKNKTDNASTLSPIYLRNPDGSKA
ncbi:MAG: tRNA (adenosine(37)-N6)-threonylcarbamoyltransferase complex dimerization subunit type 1 TsaB [Ardenticatenaceae bacterium]|nr:tRNA (adenosine(37)-N6)-threonylcarbamoyltransferase complex dimerization subunit type 1 TsaB [Ardenticatenaceae bacterium]